MKKLTALAVSATSILLLAAGCVGTLAVKKPDGGFTVARLAILYPFEVGSVKVSTTNGVYELTSYKSEGANSNTVEFASQIAEGIAEGVAKGLTK